VAAEFDGTLPPPPPLGRTRLVEPDGTATLELAQWLAKLLHFLTAPKVLRVEEVWDPVSLGPNAVSPIRTLPLPGARIGDEVIVTFNQSTKGILINGWIEAPDVINFQFINPRSTTIDLPVGTVRLRARTLD
jgi:hypothetical protein